MRRRRKRRVAHHVQISRPVLLVQGCGGGGSDSGAGSNNPPAANTCGGSISGNHGHTISIPKADLDSMTDKTYNIQGTATHNHTITLTPAQLTQLKTAGASVDVTSSTAEAHNHGVTVSCM